MFLFKLNDYPDNVEARYLSKYDQYLSKAKLNKKDTLDAY